MRLKDSRKIKRAQKLLVLIKMYLVFADHFFALLRLQKLFEVIEFFLSLFHHIDLRFLNWMLVTAVLSFILSKNKQHDCRWLATEKKENLFFAIFSF